MSFSHLRSQVDALCRKYAVELEAYRLRSVALEFCDDMADAVTGERNGPKLPLDDWALLFMRRMSDRGFRPRGLPALLNYLSRCLDQRVLPQCNNVLRAILPTAARRGLIPRSIDPVPF